MKKRIRNIYFWTGIIGVVLTSLQVEASTLTTWNSVYQLIINTLSNPYLLFTTALAIIGVVVDPTTEGLTDKKEIGHLETMGNMVENLDEEE